MVKYIIGALVLGQCCVDVGSMHALHKTKNAVQAPIVTQEAAEQSNSVLTRLSLTCNTQQRIILASVTGAILVSLLIYYRKSCMAKSLNFWDWIRRVYHTQKERDERLYANVTKGDLWWAEMWHYRGASINGEVHGESPLHKAAEQGNEHIARWLVKHGAEVDKQDSNGWTPMMRTIINPTLQTPEIIYLLKQKGANPDLSDTQEETVVHKAVSKATAKTPEFLKGLLTKENINALNSSEETPLMKALIDRNESSYAVDTDLLAQLAHILLDHGAEIHSHEPGGQGTALYRSVKGHYIPVMHRLLSLYKDSRYVEEVMEAFFFAIAHAEDNKINEPLFNKIIELQQKAQSMPGGKQREDIEIDFLKKLIQKALQLEDVTASNIMLKAFLHLCKNDYRQELLDWALWFVVNLPRQRVDLIECLLNESADVGKKHEEEGSETPLIRAVKKGHREHVKALLAKINCVRVVKTGYVELTELAKRINQADARGYTALHYAAELGDIDCVRILVEAGAEARLVTADQKTAAALAKENNRTAVVELLQPTTSFFHQFTG